MTTTTRKRILQGTADAVVERGLDGTTVQHILVASDVSRRTFYQYFRSKDHALKALYELHMGLMFTAIATAVVAEADPWQRVLDGVDAYLEYQQHGGLIVTLLGREAMRPDSLLSERRQEMLDLLSNFLETQTREVLGVEPDPLVYRGLLLGIEGLILYLKRDGTFSDDDRKRMQELIGPLITNVLITTQWLPQKRQ